MQSEGMRQFLAWLRQHRGKFRMTRLGQIRTKTNRCPLQAWTGTTVMYVGAAEMKGLTSGQAMDIILASDHATYPLPSVRTRMLKALGMTEKPSRRVRF